MIPPTVQVLLVGTAGFDIETTVENPIKTSAGANRQDLAPFTLVDQEDLAWLNDGNFTAKSASLVAQLAVPGNRGMRLVCNSYTDTAELQMWVTQPDN